MKINKIKSIEFIFENCEYIKFPVNGVEKFKVYDNGKFEEFDLVLKLVDGIDYYYFDDHKLNPLERFMCYSDITQIHIKYIDGTRFVYYPKWNEDNCNDNSYQLVDILDWDKIHISIKKENKKYSLHDILNGRFKDGEEFKGEDGRKYKLYYDEEEDNMYLFDEIVNAKLLDMKFTKV